MKWVIKAINFIKKHKGKIAVSLIIAILILGMTGNFIASLPKDIPQDFNYLNFIADNFWEIFFKSITLLGLNVPDKVNIYNGLAYFLAVVLVYAGFFLLAFNNLLNKWLFRLFLIDENIVLFGFGEINKSFLENLKNSDKKHINVIVVDKEDKDFDEFWEEGYVFLKSEIDESLINKFDFKKTSNIIVALGNDRLNIDVGLKLIEKLKDETETKLIIHINDTDISDLFFEKIEEIKEKEKKYPKINLKIFSFNTEVVDDLFEKYSTKLVPYDYAKLNSEKEELQLAVIGNSGVSLELIKRIFINFIFPNKVKIKIFLIDKNEKEFLEKVEFETNYSKEKFPHIELETKKLNYDLLKNEDFWLDKDLIDVFIAFEDENRNLEVAVDLFEKVFVHLDKKNLKYPNIFFAMYEELAFSDYIDKNKKNFKNFYTFGNIKEVLSTANLLDDEKFQTAMQIHYTWLKEEYKQKFKGDIEKAWYATPYTNRESSIAQYEHIPFKLLSFGYKICKKDCKKDYKDEYKKIIDKLDKGKISFEEFLNSGDFYTICNTEHRRWAAYHFINNWKYDEYEAKNDKEKDEKKELKLHNCLTDFKDFKYDSIKDNFIYDFYAYKNIPEYIKDKKIVKL